MSHTVTLLFDVEDLCWPGSDDITLELATRLTRHGVQGTFLVVGEKARLFAQRNRHDVVAALQEHDIGLHTNRHSIHPTVAEYLADLSWEDGVWAAYDDESEGCQSLETIFGILPSCWGQSGGSWGPQINAAMQRLNIPAVVYPQTRTQAGADLHWYAGSLVFPGEAVHIIDDALLDDTRFEESLAALQEMLDQRILNGTRWTGITVCHPTRLRATEFWDGLNFAAGTNTPPEAYRQPELYPEEVYQTGLKNIDRLITTLQQDRRVQIQTVRQIRQTVEPPEQTVYLSEIDQVVWQINHYEDIPTDFYRFSAAELLDMVVRIYSDSNPQRESIRRRHVFGPTQEPTPFDPTEEPIYWSDFVATCRMIENHVTYRQQLPANVFIRYTEWSIGAFFQAAVRAWPLYRAGKPPNYIEWHPAYMYPAVGHSIAAAVQQGYDQWPIHSPNLDSNTLLMHTCFQCWTLRPAY